MDEDKEAGGIDGQWRGTFSVSCYLTPAVKKGTCLRKYDYYSYCYYKYSWRELDFVFSKLGSSLREEQDCETRCYRREDTSESDVPVSSAQTCVAVLKIKISTN